MAYQQTGNESGRGGVVSNPPAITSAVAVAAPTKAEYDALRADVVALRTNVADLVLALRASNTVD